MQSIQDLIPEKHRHHFKPADLETKVCSYHGDYFGDKCESCERQLAQREKALVAQCESMGLAPRYHGLTFADFWQEHDGHRRALKYARRFFDGDISSLLFVGESSRDGGFGTGKTTLAAILLFEFVKHGKSPGYYCTANDIDRGIRDAMNSDSKISREEYVKNFKRKPFLVVDEVAASPLGEYTCQILSDILAERLDYELPTIICSNKGMEHLSTKVFHPRVVDRLRNDMAQVVFNWTSARGQR